MKKLIIISSIIAFISCSSKDDAGNVVTNEFERITTILPQGTWKITKLLDNTDDYTMDFESFVFTFNEDGTVAGENDLFTEVGNWLYRSTSQDGEQLILEFNDVTPFAEITDDWTIVSVTNSQIELNDYGDIEGTTNFLVFTKL